LEGGVIITLSENIKIFYCYAHKDKTLRNELDRHLGALKHSGQIITWHDREILPGTEWAHEIDIRLTTADLVLLLISAHFISSDYCYGLEMKQAISRHKAGQAHVIPIILRPVDWQGTPISELQVLPSGGKAVTSWRSRDEGFWDVAKGIRATVNTLLQQQKTEKITPPLLHIKNEATYNI
jgi:hypothetical protein